MCDPDHAPFSDDLSSAGYLIGRLGLAMINKYTKFEVFN